jgi:hydroxymethylglutaryl-CoA reductase
MALEVKIDAENITTAGSVLGGIAALFVAAMAFVKRQRSKAERWKEIELTGQNNAADIEKTRTELRTEMAAIRADVNTGFANLTRLIIERN